MKKQELSYKIEVRKHKIKNLNFISVFYSWPFLLSLIFLSILSDEFLGKDFFLLFIVIPLPILLMFFKKPSYVSRKYYIDDSGIEVNEGSRSKKYFWSDFYDFFIWNPDLSRYGYYYQNYPIKEFYLNLKNNGFRGIVRKTVVVHVDVENVEKLKEILINNVKQREMNRSDNLTVNLYDFK